MTISDEAITAVATVVAEGNRRVAAVPKVANGDYLQQIKSVQVVGLTETALDIEQAGAGTLTPADLVTRNTGAPLDEMIQVAKPGSIEVPEVSIDDALLPISASGAATHQFVIRLAAPAALPVTVSFETLVPSDSGLRVVEVAGILVLEPGETEKPIPVGVDMKTVSGADAEYFVRLTAAQHATITQSVARGIFDGPAEIHAVTLSQDLLAGELAILEAVFSDLAEQQHTATVDWGDGSQQEATIIQVGAQRTLNASHAYSRAGDYTVRIDVVDSTDQTATTERTIHVNSPDFGLIAGDDYSVTEGNTIQLNASASIDPNSDLLTYTWDLDGDGEFDDATGATPTFSAASLVAPAQQQVRVQASDGILVAEASATITIVVAAWRNPNRPLDVNGDGSISPLDALILINELNDRTVVQSDSRLPQLDDRREVAPFYDPNGDNDLSPSDVLNVINHLNSSTIAEGESPTSSWSHAIDTVIPAMLDEYTPSLAARTIHRQLQAISRSHSIPRAQAQATPPSYPRSAPQSSLNTTPDHRPNASSDPLWDLALDEYLAETNR